MQLMAWFRTCPYLEPETNYFHFIKKKIIHLIVATDNRFQIWTLPYKDFFGIFNTIDLMGIKVLKGLQDCIRHILKHFKTRLLDIDMQTQNSDIQDMDRLRTYKLLKTNFRCENYLFLVKNKMFRIALVRFRDSLLKLECNEGQYRNVPFNERVCPICHTDIKMEYHFLLVFPSLSQLRSKYMSSIWYTYPSVQYLFNYVHLKAAVLWTIFLAIYFLQWNNIIDISMTWMYNFVTLCTYMLLVFVCNFGQWPMLPKK